ncbi:MAG: efflux transporter outer rane subunit [Hydrocarboniphaga sp.]|uniref:efflux transporter outer membrane subunit n=1 Tax=Hydrocarboniphaga sp. TaxID=2033016 RepID=UPI002638AE23|nr:efflux transporter outer membrane subunit [Hydrocarboniphaga sp.]MDB5972431.1 efflux transporter outer rane subunit [Hydrocarboniphaga sp.]
MKRHACVLIVPALLSACAMGPDYQRPTLDVPPQFRLDTAAASPQSFGDLQWWDVYRDPVLATLIASAVKNNLDVRVAAARVDQARASLGATGYQLLPQISAGGTIGKQRLSAYESSTSDRTSNNAAVSGSLSWELDFWGRIRRTREAARAQLLSSEAARETVLASLVASVATQYFTLLALDEQLEITRATLESRKAFLDLTQAQFDRGTVSGLDVNTAQAQLATAQANAPLLERQIAQSENQLSLLLGGNPGAIARSPRNAGNFGLAPMSPDLPAGLPSSLLERRPDIREAEQALVAANAQIGIAKAALFPTISITGDYGSLSPKMSNLFTGAAENWAVGVNLLQPLLDADRNRYQVDYADAGRRVALLNYEKAVRTAFREVADALVTRQKSAEYQTAQSALVTAQNSAHEIALARYKVGYSSYFDVINADRDLFSAKLALSQARLDTLNASVQLYQALGGGWQLQR